ncbi:hypothetical protein GCM10009759_32720 [Kitasatospora saccharophila]|uniref:Uncharacterized protein n=1 Tax=Kitasatospora saccharophila TaxID=407973 RepID=A0ABN2WWJ2_9ACTN
MLRPGPAEERSVTAGVSCGEAPRGIAGPGCGGAARTVRVCTWYVEPERRRSGSGGVRAGVVRVAHRRIRVRGHSFGRTAPLVRADGTAAQAFGPGGRYAGLTGRHAPARSAAPRVRRPRAGRPPDGGALRPTRESARDGRT